MKINFPPLEDICVAEMILLCFNDLLYCQNLMFLLLLKSNRMYSFKISLSFLEKA